MYVSIIKKITFWSYCDNGQIDSMSKQDDNKKAHGQGLYLQVETSLT